jgi:alpha/beta superfamily hydrolase
MTKIDNSNKADNNNKANNNNNNKANNNKLDKSNKIDNVSKNLTLEVFFQGTAGRIHGKYNKNNSPSSPVILLLHPDPRQGATMDNKVMACLADVFADSAFTVLRINYRGVGKSEGVFEAQEQCNDASVTLDWLRVQNQEASHFWVCGYSLGAYIAANLMMRRPDVEGFVLISPLADKYDFSFLSPCPSSGLIVQGSNDKIVPPEEVKKLAAFMNNQNSSIVEFAEIESACHLFKDNLEELRSVVKTYINVRIATRIPKPVRKKRRRRKKRDSVI